MEYNYQTQEQGEGETNYDETNYNEYEEANYEEGAYQEGGYEEGTFQGTYDYDYNPNIISWGVAIYRYEAQNENELTFNEGEYIGILEELPDGWSKGDYYGIEGLFPTSYVQKVDTTDTAQTQTNNQPVVDEEAAKKRKERRAKLEAKMKGYKEELVSNNKERKQLEKELKELSEKKLKLQKELRQSKATLPSRESLLHDLLKLVYTIDVHTDAVVELEKPTKESVEALNQFNQELTKEVKSAPPLVPFQQKVAPKLTTFATQLQKSLEILVECQTLGMDFNASLEKLAKILEKEKL